jgi:hypothetical protein
MHTITTAKERIHELIERLAKKRVILKELVLFEEGDTGHEVNTTADVYAYGGEEIEFILRFVDSRPMLRVQFAEDRWNGLVFPLASTKRIAHAKFVDMNRKAMGAHPTFYETFFLIGGKLVKIVLTHEEGHGIVHRTIDEVVPVWPPAKGPESRLSEEVEGAVTEILSRGYRPVLRYGKLLWVKDYTLATTAAFANIINKGD